MILVTAADGRHTEIYCNVQIHTEIYCDVRLCDHCECMSEDTPAASIQDQFRRLSG